MNNEELMPAEAVTLATAFEHPSPDQLAMMYQNPMAMLEQFGDAIDPKYQESIAANMRSLALHKGYELQQTPQRRSTSTETKGQVTASAQWWGLVIELDEQATQDAIAGINMSSAVMGVVGTALGIAAGPVGAIAGCIAGALAIYGNSLGFISNGNGVYLTILWPQIPAIALNPLAITPIPTRR